MLALLNVLNSLLVLALEYIVTGTFKVLAFMVELIPTFVYYLFKSCKTLINLSLALSPVLPMPVRIPATSANLVINWPIVLIPPFIYLIYRYSLRRLLKDIARLTGYMALVVTYWFLRVFSCFLKNQGEQVASRMRKYVESVWNGPDESARMRQKKRRQTAMF